MRKKDGNRMSARDLWTLILLVLMSVFLFADQNAMNPVVNELVNEYGVDEGKIGFIGSAFTILGAAVSLIFGYLADRNSRKKLLVLVVLVGEIPCLLTGFEFFTQTYQQLMLLRILTGLGVGGIFPLTFSLIGDYFKAEHRSLVTALVGAAWGIGQIFGQTLAGFMAGTYGWRLPFILVAVPNFVLVPIFMLIAREPSRGGMEEEIGGLIESGLEYTEKIKLKDLKKIFINKTNLLGFIQGIPGSIPWGLIPFFLIPFYELNKGFSKEMATVLTLILGVGTTVGGILGGWIGEKIYKKDPAKLPVFCGIMVLIGIIPAYFLMGMQFPLHPGWNDLLLPAVLSFLTGMIVTIPGPNIKAILINVNPPENRGSVFAVHNITDSIGRGMGPAIGGALIVAMGYKFTMYFSIYTWIPCGIIYLLMARTINYDLAGLKDYLNSRKEKMLQEKDIRLTSGMEEGV